MMFFYISILLSIYVIVRMSWIKRFQMVVLLRSPSIFVHLPPFKYMLWHRLWDWNEVHFLPKHVGFEDLRDE